MKWRKTLTTLVQAFTDPAEGVVTPSGELDQIRAYADAELQVMRALAENFSNLKGDIPEHWTSIVRIMTDIGVDQMELGRRTNLSATEWRKWGGGKGYPDVEHGLELKEKLDEMILSTIQGAELHVTDIFQKLEH